MSMYCEALSALLLREEFSRSYLLSQQAQNKCQFLPSMYAKIGHTKSRYRHKNRKKYIFFQWKKQLVSPMIIHNSHCLYYGLNMIEAHRKAKISSLQETEEDLFTFLSYMSNEADTGKIFLFESLLPICKKFHNNDPQFSSVQLLSRVRLFAIP